MEVKTSLDTGLNTDSLETVPGRNAIKSASRTGSSLWVAYWKQLNMNSEYLQKMKLELADLVEQQ